MESLPSMSESKIQTEPSPMRCSKLLCASRWVFQDPQSSIRPQNLREHIRQDAAGAVVINFDRSVDADDD